MKARSAMALIALVSMSVATRPAAEGTFLAQVPPGGMLDRTPAVPRPGDVPPAPSGAGGPGVPENPDNPVPALPRHPAGVPGGNPGGPGPVNPGVPH